MDKNNTYNEPGTVGWLLNQLYKLHDKGMFNNEVGFSIDMWHDDDKSEAFSLVESIHIDRDGRVWLN